MSVLLLFYLIFGFITSAHQAITNSSGQYFVSRSKYSDEIKCNDPEFCHIVGEDSNLLEITTYSLNVFIDMIGCDYLQIFSNATNFIMINNESNYGQFHLENATNIDIHYIDVDYSVIYAQYANNLNILLSKHWNYGNIFYLDYVSNEINFQCLSSFIDSDSYYCSRETTIIASNANYFNLSIPHYFIGGGFDGIIYCPYHKDNVCNLDISSIEQINGTEIFLSDMKPTNVSPLYVDFETNASLSLNENIKMNGIYESWTDIYFNFDTKRFECKNTSRFNKISSTDICQCDVPWNIFCCPVSNFHDLRHCEDGKYCQINLENNNGTIIYANNAYSLYIICKNCSFVNIFAINASYVEIKCIDYCQHIHVNAFYVHYLYFHCSTYDACRGGNELMFDVSNAEIVRITAKNLSNTEIYAANSGEFSLDCVECKSLDLAIPSVASIKCREYCDDFIFYTNSGWQNTQNVSLCNSKDHKDWKFYCPSPINIYADYSALFNDYKRNSRLKKTFIPCKDISYTYIENPISIQMLCRDVINDLTSELKLVQTIFDIIIVIVSLVIITCWLIICGKRMFLKYTTRTKYNYVMNIEPPSITMLYYIYFNDLFIWLSQIYIIVIPWICNSAICVNTNYGLYIDNDRICSMQSSCSLLRDGYWCGLNRAVFACFMIMAVSLLISMSGAVVHVRSYVCIICCYKCCFKWDTIINDYYLRKMFTFQDDIKKELLFIAITRYLLVFVPALILYFAFNDDGVTMKWYCIFPILLVLCLNEIIKKQYKMLSPYDKAKHIQYILHDKYGHHLGSVIWMFLGDDNDINEEEMVMIGHDYQPLL